MPKADEAIKALQRTLANLELLDGCLVECVEGAFLVFSQRVRDPRPIVETCHREGKPTLAALEAGLEFERPAVRWDAIVGGSLERDLRRLETSKKALNPFHRTPKYFRRYPTPDRAWLLDRRSRFEDLSQGPLSDRIDSSDHPAWFRGVLQVIAAVRGEHAAREFLSLVGFGLENSPRAEALFRVDALAALVDARARGQTPDADGHDLAHSLAVAAEEILALQTVHHRKRLRSAARVVNRVIAWPETPKADHVTESLRPGPTREPLPALVRRIGSYLIGQIESGRDPRVVERFLCDAALCGLAFSTLDCEGESFWRGVRTVAERLDHLAEALPLPFTLRQMVTLCAGWDGWEWIEWLGPPPLLSDRVFRRQPFTVHELRTLGMWKDAGLEWELIEEVAIEQGRLYAMVGVKDFAALRAFCFWCAQVAPRYEAAQVPLRLSPTWFEGLPRGGNADLIVLARLLAAQPPIRSGSAERELALLDVTLGLARRSPKELKRLAALVDATSPGAGRAEFPAFAGWLGDDGLLDRYVHLCRELGLPVALSRNLQRDFNRGQRVRGQVEYLKALLARTEQEEARLQRLVAEVEADAIPSSAWTRRRLAEKVAELFARAYMEQIDAALRAVLRSAWKIEVPLVTPAWRDIVRLILLRSEQNQEPLRRILRYAANHPGASILSATPENRAWIAAADDHMVTTPWLARRPQDVVIGGIKYRLEMEDDPLEVLRMGVPFGTCLSIAGNVNPMGAVLNALDANKRVLYLRDSEGQMLARKLIAISETWSLIGYRLYVSLAPECHRLVADVVASYCESLAEDLKLPLSDSGRPAQIHSGDWYDDGSVPWGTEGRCGRECTTEAYCRHLGRPVPPSIPSSLYWEEAQRWCKTGSESVEDLDPDGFLAAGEGPPDPTKAAALVRAIEVLRASTDSELDHLPWMIRTETRGDVPYPRELPRHLATAPVPDVFLLLDRLQGDAEAAPWGDTEGAPLPHFPCELFAATVSAYARAPNPGLVAQVLADRRRSGLARCAALHIAARFPFPTVLRGPVPPISPLQLLEQAPLGCPRALAGLRALGDQHPAVARSKVFIRAVLRQHAPSGLADWVDLSRAARGDPPFEWLGDLLLHVPCIGEWLAPWSKPNVALGGEKWTPWQAAWYRRHPELIIRKLARRLPVGEDERRRPEEAILLGDLERWVRARRVVNPSLGNGERLFDSEVGLEARAVREQIANPRGVLGRPVEEVRRIPAEGLDPGVVREALRVLHDLSTAQDVSDLPGSSLLSTAVYVVARGAPLFLGEEQGPVQQAVVRLLMDKALEQGDTLAEDMIRAGLVSPRGRWAPDGWEGVLLEMWGRGWGRPSVLDVVDHCGYEDKGLLLIRLLHLARATGREREALDLLYHAYGREAESHARPMWLECGCGTELPDALGAVLPEKGSPAEWIRFYQESRSAREASGLLDRMVRSGAAAHPKMRAAVERAVWRGYDFDQLLRFWLEEVMASNRLP